MSITLSYSEKNKGTLGESPFEPDDMTSLNNRFFTFKNGQLYLHNDKDNPIRCNFYGEQFYPRIKTIFNQSPETDKVFKTLVLEGDTKWKTLLKTNFVESSLKPNEFVTKESREFAHLRQEESNTSTFGGAVQGVGEIASVNSLTINVSSLPDNINIGDALFQINNGEQELIGVITDYTSTSITVASAANTPLADAFCYIRKINRIEGAEVRGYYMEVTLELDITGSAELFAISTNAVKSGL